MRRFRFSIRFLAIAFLLYAMLLGYWHHLGTQRRSLARAIQNQDGGKVFWAVEPRNPILKPLKGLLPKEYWSEVLSIEATNVTDEELASISRYFKKVSSIRIKNPRLTNNGVQKLAALESLSHLAIIGDKCPDLTHLYLCQRLAKLDIDVPDFGNDQIANLTGLRSLSLLMLFRSRVTVDDLKPIATSLRNCEIGAYPRAHDDMTQVASVTYDPKTKQFSTTPQPVGGYKISKVSTPDGRTIQLGDRQLIQISPAGQTPQPSAK